jgi:microcompartment protein CcmL/EutN
MPIAVGVIQTDGFPPVVAAADAMVKAGRVAIAQYGMAERAQFFVSIRGPVSEVNQSMEAGLAAVDETFGGKVINWYIVPNPPENLETVLPIDYVPESEIFRI